MPARSYMAPTSLEVMNGITMPTKNASSEREAAAHALTGVALHLLVGWK